MDITHTFAYSLYRISHIICCLSSDTDFEADLGIFEIEKSYIMAQQANLIVALKLSNN